MWAPKKQSQAKRGWKRLADGVLPLSFSVFDAWQVFKRYTAALQEIFKECASKYLPKEAQLGFGYSYSI